LYRVTSRILGVDDKDARVGIECCAKTSTKRPMIARKQSFFWVHVSRVRGGKLGFVEEQKAVLRWQHR
jgi:hypothetical protein